MVEDVSSCAAGAGVGDSAPRGEVTLDGVEEDTSTSPKGPWRRIRRLFVRIGRIFVLAYVGLALVLLLFQRYLVFRPDKEISMTPGDLQMNYDDVYFSTSDGVKLNAWFIPADDPRGVVLLCHGNAGNISHRLATVALYRRLGMSVLLFDYRGYGRSDGEPSEEGTYLDAEGAWDYLTGPKGFTREEIVIVGRSLGGSVGAHLASGTKPAALVVESTFTSMGDMGAELYPYLPVRLLCRFGYDTLDSISKAGCPVLVVHSRDDEMIPFEHGRRVFDAAPQPKEFLEISGGHNDGFIESVESYLAGLDSFLSKYISHKQDADEPAGADIPRHD